MALPTRYPRWIAAALVFLLLTAGAGGWMQTQDAFQRLWLPLTAQLLGGTWSAEQGRLGLDGTFEADGLRFVAPDLGQGVVERVQLKLRPWASLWRGAAVIEQIQVAGADLNLREAADAADAGPDTRSSDRGPFSFNWPVIEQARVDDTWIRTEAGAYALVLGPLTARIEGSEGRKLSVEVPVELLAEGDELRGRLTSALEFSSGESDTDQGTFDGNLDLALDSQTRSPIVLKLHGEGRTAGERVELTGVEVDWRVAGSPVLELTGSGTLSPEPMLDAHLVMAEAGLVASLLGESSLEARIEGDVHVEGSFDELVIEPALVVGELRATPDASTPLSEPLQVKGRMTWLRRKQALLLEPLELAGGSAEGLGALSLEGTLQSGLGGELAIRAEAFDVLPWLRLATGASGVALVRGPIQGSVALRQTPDETTVEADLELTVLAAPADAGQSAAGPPLRLNLQNRQTTGDSGPQFEGRATLQGPGASGVAGSAGLTWESELTGEQVQTRVRGDIASFDLTSVATLWEGSADEMQGPEAGDSAPVRIPDSLDTSDDRREGLVDLDVSVGALQLRELPVRGGRVRGQFGGGSWEVRVEELGVAEGLVDFEAYGGPHGGGERVGWNLVIADVDVAAWLAAVSPDGERQLSGRLSLESRAEGVAAPGEDLLTAPNGRVSFELSEGRAEGLVAQQLLTQVAEIAQFAVIDYDEVDGDYPIENGRVLIDELRLDGAAVHLVATGEVGLQDVDLVINPRLGPSLRAMVPLDMLGRVVGTANQLLALPVVIVVNGPLPGFEVELQPAAPSVLHGSFSGLSELLTPEGPPPVAPPPGS